MKGKKLLILLATLFLTGCMSLPSDNGNKGGNDQQTPSDGGDTNPDDGGSNPDDGGQTPVDNKGPITKEVWDIYFGLKHLISDANYSQRVKQFAGNVLKSDAVVKLDNGKLEFDMYSVTNPTSQPEIYLLNVVTKTNDCKIGGFQYYQRDNKWEKYPIVDKDASMYFSYFGIIELDYADFSWNETLQQYELNSATVLNSQLSELVVKFDNGKPVKYTYSFVTGTGASAVSGVGEAIFSEVGTTKVDIPTNLDIAKPVLEKADVPVAGDTLDNKETILSNIDNMDNFEVRYYEGYANEDEQGSGNNKVNMTYVDISDNTFVMESPNKIHLIKNECDTFWADADDYLAYKYGSSSYTKEQLLQQLFGSAPYLNGGFDYLFDTDEIIGNSINGTSGEMYLALDSKVNQYFYMIMEDNDVDYFHYFQDYNEYLRRDNLEGLQQAIQVVRRVIAEGEHDSSKHTYRAEPSSIDVGFFDEEILAAVEYIEVSIKNNYPYQASLKFKQVALEEFDVKDVSFFVTFSNIGTTSVTLPSYTNECEHERYGLWYNDEGHRNYCYDCGLFVDQLVPHNDDNDYCYCIDCGHQPHTDERKYDTKIFENDDYELYAFSYKEPKPDFINEVYMCQMKLKDPNNHEVSPSESYYFDNYQYHLATQSVFYSYLEYNTKTRLDEHHCAFAVKCHSQYFDLTGVEVTKGEDNYTLYVGTQKLDAYLSDKTPTKEMIHYEIVVEHDYQPVHTQIDPCHERIDYACTICGAIDSSRIEENHHYEFEIVSYLDAMKALNNDSLEGADHTYVKMTCPDCHDVLYGVFDSKADNHNIHDNGKIGVHCYYLENGEVHDDIKYINVPHIYGEDGHCILCDEYREVVGSVVVSIFGYAPHYRIYDLNGEEIVLGWERTVEGEYVEEDTYKDVFELRDDHSVLIATVTVIYLQNQFYTETIHLKVESGDDVGEYDFTEFVKSY